MAMKSIYEIDVDDSKFVEFQALFERHREAIAKLPAGWGKIKGATDAAASSFDDLVAAAQLTAGATAAIALNQEKMAVTGRAADHAAESLSRNTGKVAGNIKDATLSLIKWTGILSAVGGLLGAGGIWGVDRLGESAAGARRSAMGLGVSSGQQQAFGINYGRVVDANSFLGRVADAKSDYQKQFAFGALGINNFDNRDAADLAPDVIQAIKNKVGTGPIKQQMLQAYGIDQFATVEDARRIQAMPQSEIDQMRRQTQTDTRDLAVSDPTQKAWTDFVAQMQRAGQTIENTFITGLVPLAKPLGDVSKGFVDIAAALLKSPEIKGWITDLGDGLESFAGFIGTPKFKSDVEDFAAGVGRVAEMVWGAIKWITGHVPAGVAAVSSDWHDRANTPDEASRAGIAQRAARHWRSVTEQAEAEKKEVAGWQSSAKIMDRTWADPLIDRNANDAGVYRPFAHAIFKAEGGLNPDGSARISPSGAIGAGQLMPGTALDLGVNPYDLADNVHGSTLYMKQMLNAYGGDYEKASAAYNWGQGNLNRDIEAHKDKWRDFLPAETKKYTEEVQRTMLAVKDPDAPGQSYPSVSGAASPAVTNNYHSAPARAEITVNNATGGSATITANNAAVQ